MRGRGAELLAATARPRGFFGVFCAAALVLSVAGCGGAAQRVLSAQAEVHVATRGARVSFYEERAAFCQSSETTLERWEACMAPAVHVQRAADSYRAALLGGQAALRAGRPEAEVLPCVVAAAVRFVEALTAANVPIPDEVLAIAEMAKGMEEVCDAG